jgi:hypothetical protein
MSWVPSGGTLNTMGPLRPLELAILAGQARKRTNLLTMAATAEARRPNLRQTSIATLSGQEPPHWWNWATGTAGRDLTKAPSTLLRCRKQCHYGVAAGRSTLAPGVPSSSSSRFVLNPCGKLCLGRKSTASSFTHRRKFNACIVVSSGSRGR